MLTPRLPLADKFLHGALLPIHIYHSLTHSLLRLTSPWSPITYLPEYQMSTF